MDDLFEDQIFRSDLNNSKLSELEIPAFCKGDKYIIKSKWSKAVSI